MPKIKITSSTRGWGKTFDEGQIFEVTSPADLPNQVTRAQAIELIGLGRADEYVQPEEVKSVAQAPAAEPAPVETAEAPPVAEAAEAAPKRSKNRRADGK